MNPPSPVGPWSGREDLNLRPPGPQFGRHSFAPCRLVPFAASNQGSGRPSPCSHAAACRPMSPQLPEKLPEPAFPRSLQAVRRPSQESARLFRAGHTPCRTLPAAGSCTRSVPGIGRAALFRLCRVCPPPPAVPPSAARCHSPCESAILCARFRPHLTAMCRPMPPRLRSIMPSSSGADLGGKAYDQRA